MISVIELKKYLKDKSSEQLTDEIVNLFKNIKHVEAFYNNKLSKSTEVIEKYKKLIEKKIMPSKNFSDPGLHLAEAKKLISEFKKVTTNKSDIADIMLFYVEIGVKLTNSFGDIDENFYSSMEGMYDKSLSYISKNKLNDIFRLRCLNIVEKASNIGWGFPDTLQEMFDNYFGNE